MQLIYLQLIKVMLHRTISNANKLAQTVSDTYQPFVPAYLLNRR